MSRELLDKLNTKRSELTSQLKELEKEKKALVAKVNNGERLNSKENKRNQDLTNLIKDIKISLNSFSILDTINKIREDFDLLVNGYPLYSSGFASSTPTSRFLSSDDEDSLIKSLKNSYKKLNDMEKKELLDSTKLKSSDLKDVIKLVDNIKKNIDDKKADIITLEGIGKDTTSLKNELKEQEETLEKIKKYVDEFVFESYLDRDATYMRFNSPEPADDKKKLLDSYLDKLNIKEQRIAEKLENDLKLDNTDSAEKATKPKTTDKDKSRRNAIIGTAIGAAVFCFLSYFAGKYLNKDDNINPGSRELPQEPESTHSIVLDTPSDSNIEKLIDRGYSQAFATIIVNNYSDEKIARILAIPMEKVDSIDKIADVLDKIDGLVTKGYDERHAILFVTNFSNKTIDKILDMPYYEVINSYAKAKDFDIDYLEDYETYKEMFNITGEKVVDYVNRSYKIQATNFYHDASIDDIIKVVMAIDNKDLFRTENASQAQSINTGFNRIVDNYLFGTTTEDDINKLDAIKYFAKEDSDLGNFLNTFSELSQNIVKNPEDNESRNNMIKFVSIFATSLNGFTNEPSTLTSDEEFNKNAQVNDYFDWYMAYVSFVGPLGDVLMYPKELESVDLFYAEEIYHDTKYYDVNEDETMEDALKRQQETRKELLEKFGYGKYLNSINNLYTIYDLRELMLTALKDPEFKNICEYGQSRILGGE